MNLVTGKKSNAHVSSDDFRKIVESLVGGGGSFVSSVGTELQTSVSGTTLSIGKGMIVHHGCVFETSNSGDTVSFQAGSSGMNRIDLICVKYTRNNTTGIEDAVWNVLQGTATSGTPVQPTVPSGDLRDDNATQDYCPVFKLTLTGNTPTVQLLLNTIPIDDAYHKPSTGIPSSHMTSAVQASLNLANSAVQMSVLWTNSSQTSAFVGQSISVNGSGYTHYIVIYRATTSNANELSVMFKVGEQAQMQFMDYITAYSTHYNYSRSITASSASSVTFSNQTNNGSSDTNDKVLPLYIIGVKGVS